MRECMSKSGKWDAGTDLVWGNVGEITGSSTASDHFAFGTAYTTAGSG
jgi:hypothetical protein